MRTVKIYRFCTFGERSTSCHPRMSIWGDTLFKMVEVAWRQGPAKVTGGGLGGAPRESQGVGPRAAGDPVAVRPWRGRADWTALAYGGRGACCGGIHACSQLSKRSNVLVSWHITLK